MGKGSGRRPTFVSDAEFAANMAQWQTPKPKKEPYVPPPLKETPEEIIARVNARREEIMPGYEEKLKDWLS